MSYKTKLIIALGLVYVVWGSTFLGMKYAIEVLPPMMVSCLRFLTGGILLFIFTLWKGYGIPDFKEIRNAAVVGVTLSGIGNCTVAYALRFMPSGLVALLVATLPAWMIMLDFLFFSKAKPTFIGLIGLVIGLFGMAYLLDPMNPANTANREVAVFPALLVFAGSVAWAFGSLKSPYMSLPKPVQSTAIQMITGGCFSLVMSLIFEENHVQAFRNMTQETWLALIYLIVVGSYIGYSAYLWLINNAPPQVTATYAYVNPVVAFFLGWIFKGEVLTPRSLVASAIVLTGVILMTMGRKKNVAINTSAE
ncbi:EamA family transporter [Emticicia sp. 21SJ11W-3]|uniref:EamA family transporter n=1 Tax=Emticicia sp. 21SJ11W-3 TaxID=2916755 RepID=UPI0020A06D0D|nr:EamA family transporter [Emticicia sp. 21SJ11W-3]UTA68361.1 EamA family transporter [Emticicia sp. 21SJ11W-3]